MAKGGAKRKQNVVYGKALPTWDEELFLHLCKDRGYYQRTTVVYYLAKEMGVKFDRMSKMISTGKFKWEQILFIGAFFEMTPKEFCDIFLSGYFRENNQGHYVSYLENPKEVLQKPEQSKQTAAEEKQQKIDRIKAELEKMG